VGVLLVLGAGYLGAAVAQRALAAGDDVVLADNWHATERAQLDGLAAAGARVETADIRDRTAIARLLGERPDRVILLAAQASRPASVRDPDYTEETNLLGVRRVAEAVGAAGGPPVVFGSSLHVYGAGLSGLVRADHPYGPQSDLAHLSKIYGELCLRLHAERHGFALALLRLGIVYGPSPVRHSAAEAQTVVDKFRRQVAAGERLTLDDGGRTTIGVVHVDDAARILLACRPTGLEVANVAAETVTVADIAAMAEGRRPAHDPSWRADTVHDYTESVGTYLRAPTAG